jgi:hypothetical protein
LKSPLTPRQVDYLDRYGYPYVFDEFRFHMTLTGPIPDEAERNRIAAALSAAYVQAVRPGRFILDALAVYRQPDRNSRFRIIAHCPLMAPAPTAERP